jgi:hypothetical protein
MIKQPALGIALALVVTPFTAGAQETPPQSPTAKQFIAVQACDDVIKIMDTIAKYRENPLFQSQTITQSANSGEWYEGKSMMFVNWETSTYSFVTLYPDGTACMQAIGREFRPYEGPLLYADR